MARGRTRPALAPGLLTTEPVEAPPADPLTALIRAAVRDAVRAEFDVLRAELGAERPAAPRHGDRLGKAEAARVLGCSTRQVGRLIATGRLRAAKLATGGSSRVLIERASIETLLAGATV